MVSGIVRPPALDLANRDLVEAHLHAVWLAESGKPLEGEISPRPRSDRSRSAGAEGHRRSLCRPGFDSSIGAVDASHSRQHRCRAHAGRGAMGDRSPEPSPTALPSARRSRFSESFDRWRQLYDGARAQLKEANRRSEMHGLPAAERREAKAQQAQANEQIALLERGSATGGSDFSTYRYLATEGFLPGYNFPRLPLYAYVPAVTGGGPKAAYLQRARFIAIAEFGPRSLIYHEGRAYRVYKAKLPPGIRAEEGGRLATDVIYVCDECGAAHQQRRARALPCVPGADGRHSSDPECAAHRQRRDAAGRAHHGQRRGSAAAGLRHPDRVRLAAARRRDRCHDGRGKR